MTTLFCPQIPVNNNRENDPKMLAFGFGLNLYLIKANKRKRELRDGKNGDKSKIKKNVKHKSKRKMLKNKREEEGNERDK